MKSFNYSVAIVMAILTPSIFLRPMATDILWPVIPTIGQDAHIPFSSSQWILNIFFIGSGFGQLVVGPLSDEYGRKRILVYATWLILITSIACTQSTDLNFILLLRLLQGLGCCGTAVVCMAMLRDLYGEHKLGKVYSYWNTIVGFSPIVCPIISGILITQMPNWHNVFYLVIVVALLALIMNYGFIVETNPAITRRHDFEKVPILKSYKKVLTDSQFWCFCLCTVMGTSYMYVFSEMSSILLIDVLKMAPETFTYYFCSVMILQVIGTMVSPMVQNKIGMHETVVLGSALMVIAGFIQNIIHHRFGLSVWGLIAPNMLCTFGAAITFGPCMAGAVADYKHTAGIASAAYGAIYLGGSTLILGLIMKAAIGNGASMSLTMMLLGFTSLITIRCVQLLQRKARA